jgi:hypothetical protein
VDVIGHQDIGMDGRLVTLARPHEQIQVRLVVALAKERLLAVVSTVDDVKRDSG